MQVSTKVRALAQCPQEIKDSMLFLDDDMKEQDFIEDVINEGGGLTKYIRFKSYEAIEFFKSLRPDMPGWWWIEPEKTYYYNSKWESIEAKEKYFEVIKNAIEKCIKEKGKK